MNNGKKRVSITQVAKHAGVSVTTASFVLNGKAVEMRLSDKCVDRVMHSAKTLNYKGNYHAKNLVRGTSMTLGFVSRFLDRDQFRPIISDGVMSEATSRGYEILNISSQDPQEAYERGLRYVEEGRVDGLVVFTGVSLPLPKDPVPLVNVWFSRTNIHPLVTIDPRPGIRDAVQHLAGLGHRKIMWLGIRTKVGVELPERREAFVTSIAEFGLEAVEYYLDIEPARQMAVGRTISTFSHALSEGLPDLDGVSGVICYNDNMALALNLLLAQRGYRIPQDISVIGFDDLQAFQGVPPLTTISHMFHEMGERAVELIFEMLAEPKLWERYSQAVFEMPTKLIVRDSTGLASGVDVTERISTEGGSV